MDTRTDFTTQAATWRPAMVHARLRSYSSMNVNGIAVKATKPGIRAHFPGLTATTRRRIPL